MFLLLNALVASLDGLIIGIGLRLANISLTKKNILIILLCNIFIYTFFLILYYYFKLTFMTKTISTILYLFLAWRSFKEEEHSNYAEKLNTLECIILSFTHSLDGTILSLNFVYIYNLLIVVGIFSFMSIFILLIGYYFSTFFKNIKKSNYISSLLFILLAIINQFL